ncbi:hypothetical protein [Xanthomonas prunicola]|nr:hypothetical protein [Xanthomonas prunicola]
MLTAILLGAVMPAAWAGSDDASGKRDWIVSGAELMQGIEGK